MTKHDRGDDILRARSGRGDPREIVCELARRLYALGWVSGTGGGIALRDGDRCIVAPSGVQKELLAPEDLFAVALDGSVLERPLDPSLRLSACAPIFLEVLRRGRGGAVIHSHSPNAVLATLMTEGAELRLTHLEMIKGIAGHGYRDVLRIPILDNTAYEHELVSSIARALDEDVSAHAVLVRRHGLYVWGRDFVQAKTHAECLDHLFFTAREMRRMGVDPASAPRERVRADACAHWLGLDEAGAITPAELASEGVILRRLELAGAEPALARFMTEHGYRARDVVELSSATEELDSILARFAREHLHVDDEVRFVYEGEGIFDIRSRDDRWMRIVVRPGDLIVVPRGRYHRFTLGPKRAIRCARLFEDAIGWTPSYRDGSRPRD